jgi:DNA-directed RNA polymerase specialized sigma24 family protein
MESKPTESKDPTGAEALTKIAAAAFPRGRHSTRRSNKGQPAKPSEVCSKSADERGALIALLMGPLWGMAWRLAAPDCDIAEELRAHVLLKCELGCYNPRKGRFTAWARKVMTRHLITLLRSRGRAAGGEDAHPERLDPHTDATADDTCTTAFSAADLARIEKWNPRKRAILLARSLLWTKLPAALWVRTLTAAGLPATFPGAEFEEMNAADRNLYLAEVFGVPRNTIHVRVKRWLHHLLELRFVRELAERHGGRTLEH